MTDQPLRTLAQGFHGAVRTLMLWLLGTACALQAEAACLRGAPQSLLQPLGPHTWWVAAARGPADADNGGLTAQLLLAREGSRLWLIGSGPTPAFGTQLACAVRRATGAAVTDIVNTRAVPELSLANSAFPQARVWALPEVAETMRRRCAECLASLKAQIGDIAGASLRVRDIRPPRQLIGGPGELSGSLGPFDWQAVQRAPGEALLLLRHRADAVTVAQGLLWAGDVPDLRQTRAAPMLQAWQTLRLFAGGDRLIGEQGGVSDGDVVSAHERYLRGLQALIGPALDRGEVWGGSALDLPDEASLPGYARRHPLNAQHLWLEMEGDLFR